MQLWGKGLSYFPFGKELVSNIWLRHYNIHQKMLDGYQSKEVKSCIQNCYTSIPRASTLITSIILFCFWFKSEQNIYF